MEFLRGIIYSPAVNKLTIFLSVISVIIVSLASASIVTSLDQTTTDSHHDDGNNQDSSSHFSQAFQSLGISPKDLAIRTDRLTSVMNKSALIDALLQNPLQIPKTMEDWSHTLNQTSSSAEILLAAQRLSIGLQESSPIPGSLPELPSALKNAWPPPIAGLVRRLLGQLQDAQQLLEQSVSSLPETDRKSVIQILLSYFQNPNHEDLSRDFFLKLKHFQLKPILQATYLLTRQMDEIIPVLQKNPPLLQKSVRWTLPGVGDVLLSTDSKALFTKEDLNHTTLLFHWGKESVYEGPVASAHEKEIRMVADFAEMVTIRNDSDDATMGSAGAGALGIGLLYLPNPVGLKTIHSTTLAQGAGLLGVGGLFASGQVDLTAHEFGQGAGTFGVGLLSVEQGNLSQYNLRLSGQGFGFTQGVGLFRHQGDHSKIVGGLYYPDPREDKAIISLTQGVGYGLRATAAGGTGIAYVEGDGISMQASYFAQGAGYWYGLGGLIVKGNNNYLQSRRYAQGAGIHTAIGVFRLEGNHNRTDNWGVMAYGWDYGLGSLTVLGNDNAMRNEWASGHGEVNGHGLFYLQGDRNRLSLAGLGTGQINRNAPGYGVAVVDGKDNRYQYSVPEGQKTDQPRTIMDNPWGILTGVIPDPTLTLDAPVWPESVLSRKDFQETESKALNAQLSSTQTQSLSQQMNTWLDVASAFSLDEATPRKAISNILAAPRESMETLVALVSPDSVDRLLRDQSAIASWGPQIQSDLLKCIPQTSNGQTRALLIGLLRYTGTSSPVLISELEKASHDSDWRVRQAVANTLGSLWSNDPGGSFPGRRIFLKKMLAWSQSKAPPNISEMSDQAFLLPDVLSTLAMVPSESIRKRFPELLPSDGFPASPVDAKGWAVVSEIIRSNSVAYFAAIQKELSSDTSSPHAMQILQTMQSQEKDPEVRKDLFIALGQIGGSKKDNISLFSSLSVPNAVQSHAAALGLGKQGQAAEAILTKALAPTSSLLERKRATLAVIKNTNTSVFEKLWPIAVQDHNRDVRLLALAGLNVLERPISAQLISMKVIQENLRRTASSDSDPSVRLSANRALDSLYPKK